jgi:colicin import membrane protein
MKQLVFSVLTPRSLTHGLLMLWLLTAPWLAQAKASEDYAVRFAKAQSLTKQGDDSAASEIYEALIKQDPSQPQAYNNLAAIKARHGEYKQAQALLEQALRSNPVYATVYENLSAIYVEMARDSYGKALHLETPQQAIALRELEKPAVAKPAPVQLAAAPAIKPTPSAKQSAPAQVALAKTENTPEIKAEETDTPAVTEAVRPAPAVTTPAPAQKVKDTTATETKIAETQKPPQAIPPIASTETTPAQAQTTTTIAETKKPETATSPQAMPPVATDETASAQATPVKHAEPAAAVPARPPAVAQPPEASHADEVITTLQGWAAAWSGKSEDLYLSFYTDDFASKGMTHQQWQAQRRARLQAPKSIEVSLSDFQVKPTKDGQVRVRLTQAYKADNYQDRTRKQFRLRHTPDGWRIDQEKTIAVLH